MNNKRRLGKTDIVVSEIGLGGFQLGEKIIINNEANATFGGMSEKDAIELINKAVGLGINSFDTADVYGMGSSEYRLGKALKEIRKDVKIFTKAGNTFSNPAQRDISYHHLMASINRSLKRLQTNYVDLFQVHVPPKTEKEFSDVEKTFNEIRSEQKAKYFGISVGIRYEEGLEVIRRGIVDTIQIYFSLIDPKPLKELFPLAKKNNVGIIVAEPLAQGLLTNKYKIGHTFPKNDLRSGVYSKELIDKKLKRVNELNFLIKDNRSMNQAALSYVLSKEEVSLCIPGAKSIDQLLSNVKSSELKLEEFEIRKISELQKKWEELDG